jgi:hypothetical protein
MFATNGESLPRKLTMEESWGLRPGGGGGRITILRYRIGCLLHVKSAYCIYRPYIAGG